jgi:myosin heavy subunit
MEMMEYEAEGIPAETLSFTDNQTLLVERLLIDIVDIYVMFVRVKELFMGKPLGILSLLDDESRLPKVSRYHSSCKRIIRI